jgi:epoxyqueuosine reductase
VTTVALDYAALKALAARAARDLGAGSMRVTSARTDAPARERMGAAFARGDLATWGYDASYARRAADPSALLEGAQTILCLAFPYATPPPRSRDPLSGRVSNYAWSPDYHARVRAALTAVASVLDRAAGGAVTAIACDTRPLAERAFAARAGTGWIGKHTNLIAPQLGSFVFLGEIVTTLPLPVDAPLRRSCGSCTRCVDVCPTGALRGDYTIDATRCISDLTQRTDAIPRDLRPLIGLWVWGCDLCQLVCPPTQNAGLRGSDADRPLDARAALPPLLELLDLRSGAFRRRYAKTAMGWRGAAVLRRNAAVALGNTLDRAAAGPLAAALANDPHPMVRGHAAWALGRIGSPSAVSALERRDGEERDDGVREEIAAAIATLR